MNCKNMSVDAAARFYPFPRACTWIQVQSRLENSMEGKNSEGERDRGKKKDYDEQCKRNSLSLYASLYTASSLYWIPPTEVLNSFFLHAVGEGRAPVQTHWHTYRSFPFLRFEYHKTWRLALKAAQTAMQSQTKLVVSQQCAVCDCCDSIYVECRID